MNWMLPLAQETPAPTTPAPTTPAPQPAQETQTTTSVPGTPGAPGAPGGKEPAPGLLSGPFVPMLIIIVVMYFFLFRSKKTQEKKRVQMLDALKKGDRIQTIGGIRGTVVDVREDEAVVKVDETSNTKLHFARSAIHKVLEEEKKS
jgi:preprotein translocase subunit YajC